MLGLSATCSQTRRHTPETREEVCVCLSVPLQNGRLGFFRWYLGEMLGLVAENERTKQNTKQGLFFYPLTTSTYEIHTNDPFNRFRVVQRKKKAQVTAGREGGGGAQAAS